MRRPATMHRVLGYILGRPQSSEMLLTPRPLGCAGAHLRHLRRQVPPALRQHADHLLRRGPAGAPLAGAPCPRQPALSSHLLPMTSTRAALTVPARACALQQRWGRTPYRVLRWCISEVPCAQPSLTLRWPKFKCGCLRVRPGAHHGPAAQRITAVQPQGARARAGGPGQTCAALRSRPPAACCAGGWIA